jgi:hypothetical protein
MNANIEADGNKFIYFTHKRVKPQDLNKAIDEVGKVVKVFSKY